MRACVCCGVGNWLNEMEIFSECSTQYSGMKCVSLPGEGKRVKGGFVMELQLLIGRARQSMGLFILTDSRST